MSTSKDWINSTKSLNGDLHANLEMIADQQRVLWEIHNKAKDVGDLKKADRIFAHLVKHNNWVEQVINNEERNQQYANSN